MCVLCAKDHCREVTRYALGRMVHAPSAPMSVPVDSAGSVGEQGRLRPSQGQLPRAPSPTDKDSHGEVSLLLHNAFLSELLDAGALLSTA